MPFWQGHYSSMLLLVLKSGLVSWKCNRTRYLGMILELGFVLLTPIEQLWPSLDTCPTKSSDLKFMLSSGIMWQPDSTMCMNVWNLNSMFNISKPFDEAHLLRKSYDRKNLGARFMLLSNSWGLRFLLHHRHRSNDTGSPRLHALQKCFVSAPLASNFG